MIRRIWNYIYKHIKISSVILGFIISVSVIYAWLSKPSQHVHNYACYNAFIQHYKLEIPKHNNTVSLIVHLHMKIRDENSEEATIRKSLKTCFATLMLQSSSTVARYTTYKDDYEQGKCIIISAHDQLKSVLPLHPSVFIEGESYFYFIASKDSVLKAESSLLKIHNDNIKDIIKEPENTHTFRNYGNAITITLEESNKGGFNAYSNLECYNPSDKLLPQAKEAYKKFTVLTSDPVYFVEKGKTASIFYPLIINTDTARACIECHSLDNSCPQTKSARL